MYLGMKISELGHRDTVDLTVRHRVGKAWGAVANIKSSINDARMRRQGWLRSGILLFRSVIIPSISYSGDVWWGELGYGKVPEGQVQVNAVYHL